MAGKLSHVLTGVAGEYFVAAELSRRGYIASITLRNTQGIDLLASDQNATRQIAIQVKTNQKNFLPTACIIRFFQNHQLKNEGLETTHP